MRDLRDNIRKYSEPITIRISPQVVINGIVQNDTATEYKAYANVMKNKTNLTNQTTGQESNQDEIVIDIRRTSQYEIVPQTTTIVVRGKNYKVFSVDAFGINTESQRVFCKEING